MHRRMIGIGMVALAAGVAVPVTAWGQVAYGGSSADPVDVLLSRDEALREIFPAWERVVVREWRPTAAERRAVEARLGRRLFEPTYPFLLVYDESETFLGYALVTEERGKYRPITFMVGITADGGVKGAAVMVYRESRGGEVRRERFLTQYRGKTLDDPIRINRDIINISGATISVRSMNSGVRKVLALVEAAFGGDGAAPAAAVAGAEPSDRLP